MPETEIKASAVTLGQKIGAGGFGEVYLGTWAHQEVAVKQLTVQQFKPDAESEFFQETGIHVQLRHDNIVLLYGVVMQQPYQMVMQYLPKGSLDRVLAKEKNLSWTLRGEMGLGIAKGVAYLHDKGILHRDLKSLNVLVGKHYEVKLADFGLAKVKHETSSKTGVSGSALWMAPELFDEGSCSKASDMYSYGIVLWEIANQKLPWQEVPSAVVPTRVMTGKREAISNDTPPTMREVIEGSWVNEPEKRLTADEAVRRLASEAATSALNSDPVYDTGMLSRQLPSKGTKQKADKIKANKKNAPVSSFPSPGLFHATPPKGHSAAPTFSPQEVDELLHRTMEGDLKAVEKILQQNPTLAQASGTITDLSERTFPDITAFQYAVWAVDVEMWDVILKYLDLPKAAEQFRALYQRTDIINKHGQHYDIQALIDVTQEYLDKAWEKKWHRGYKWSVQQREDFWCKRVGGAQRLCPAWLVFLWCEPGKDVAWVTQKFTGKDALSRDEYIPPPAPPSFTDVSDPLYVPQAWTAVWDRAGQRLNWWLDQDYASGRLAGRGAVYRAARASARRIGGGVTPARHTVVGDPYLAGGMYRQWIGRDVRSFKLLKSVRHDQQLMLKTTLYSASSRESNSPRIGQR